MILFYVLLADAILLTYLYFEDKGKKDLNGEKKEPKKKSVLDHCYKYFLIVTFILVSVLVIIFHFTHE